MELSAKAKQYYDQHYGQLIGFTVEGVGIDDSDEDLPPTFCLIMTKGATKLNVFIGADEEGNGPGFLEIEQNRDKENSQHPNECRFCDLMKPADYQIDGKMICRTCYSRTRRMS